MKKFIEIWKRTRETYDAEKRFYDKEIDRAYFQKLLDGSYGTNELIIERPDGVRFIIHKAIERATENESGIGGESW